MNTMKKGVFLFLTTILFSTIASAQLSGALNQLKQNSGAAATQLKLASLAETLTGFNNQLKKTFGVEAVKSQLVGDDLKVKVANAAFTKMNSAARTTQAKAIAEGAKTLVEKDATTLLKGSVKTVTVDLVKSITENGILSTARAAR